MSSFSAPNFTLWILGLLAPPGAQADQPPKPDLIEKIREYATNFRTPDVAWDSTITISTAKSGMSRFHKDNVLHSERFYQDGVEYVRAIGSNGKPKDGSKWKHALKGSDLFRAIAARTTTIEWERPELLKGRRTEVFRFRVEQQDSD